MTPVRKATICIPTRDGGATIGRCLGAALSQTVDVPYDICVGDAGSRDGTLELVRAFPVRCIAVEPGSNARNAIAARADGDALVFLAQDAIPADDRWLASLLRALDEEQVAAAWSRRVPRLDAPPLEALAALRDDSGALDFDAACVRRELWRRLPIPAAGAEPRWIESAAGAGYRVVLAREACVFHRARTPARGTLLGAIASGARAAFQDARAVARLNVPRRKKWSARLLAPGARVGEAIAAWRGRPSQARAQVASPSAERLRVLYVAHGFPPESSAGTEVYARELALAMAARGHDVGVFHRSKRDDVPDLALWEETADGLRCFRVANRLHFRHAGESYAHSAIEARFRDVLARFRPDVVHFQHLIHLSAGLVGIAREHGAATVVTFADYWAICPRVQLVRPDGSRCDGRQELGCFLCLKEKRLGAIGAAAAASRGLRPLVELGMRRIEADVRAGRNVGSRRRDLLEIYRRDRAVVGAFASADLLLSPSLFLRDALLDRAPELDWRRIAVSDYGMRADGPAALGKTRDPQRRVRFGFVGSLVSYKGIEVAIDAMARLDDPRAVLLVFGEFHPDRDAFHARLLAKAPAGRVEFRGGFDNARVSEVFAEIDALVVPSTWWENAPLAIREAQLTATPTIVSDLGAMPESAGGAGLLFKAGDACDLAARLQWLMSDPTRLASIAREAPARKTIAENAAELDCRYRELLATRARAEAPR